MERWRRSHFRRQSKDERRLYACELLLVFSHIGKCCSALSIAAIFLRSRLVTLFSKIIFAEKLDLSTFFSFFKTSRTRNFSILRDLSNETKVSRITEIYTCGFSKIKCLQCLFLFFSVPSATLSRLPFVLSVLRNRPRSLIRALQFHPFGLVVSKFQP